MTITIYTCCFWFSLRLGSLICSLSSALKAVCILVVLLPRDMENMKNQVGKFLFDIDYNKAITNLVINDFELVLIITSSFFGLYLLSCILLSIGAVLCKQKLCYPFIYLHMVLVVADCLVYTVLFKYLMYLAAIPVDESHTSNIGLAHDIFFLTIGLLYIFYDIYLVVCVQSFTKALKILRKEVTRKSFQPVLPLIFKPENIAVNRRHAQLIGFDGALFTRAFRTS